MIVGDFNCSDIDWISFQPQSDNIQNYLFDFFISNGFTQNVTEPTRIDGDDDELDNLYCAITLESREYYTSRARTTAEKKFETSVS